MTSDGWAPFVWRAPSYRQLPVYPPIANDYVAPDVGGLGPAADGLQDLWGPKAAVYRGTRPNRLGDYAVDCRGALA
jgi:hypothetical protein